MDELNIQSQNFNVNSVGNPAPSEPKRTNGVLIGIIAAIVIAAVAGAAYYFLVPQKQAALENGAPTAPPQVVGPQTPPPGQSDDLDSISNDLNAMDLNALDKDVQTDASDLNGLLQ